MAENITGLLAAMQEQQKLQMEQFQAIIGQLSKTQAQPTQLTINVPRFDSYDRDKETWTQYLQRLTQHFTVYNITDNIQQRACLLSWVGAETYELLTKLYGQDDITTKGFNELTARLSEHFTDKKHVQAARYQFYNCKMKPEQSYSDWAADLRGIARNCNFICKKTGCNESYVDDQIRDIIIKETPHADVRRQCLLDTDPSLDEVLKKANTFITTTETDKVLKGETTEPTTHQMASSYKETRSKPQQFNGRPAQDAGKPSKLRSCPQCYIHHDRKECPHRYKKCNSCSLLGHISSVCLKANKTTTNSYHSNNVDDETSNVFQITEATNNIYERRGKQVWINALVNSTPASFQWDTGATCSMVGLRGYRQLGSPPCQPSDTTLRAYGNSALKVKGQCFVSVQVGQTQRENLRLLVVDSEHGANLLGLDWSDEFGLSQQGLAAVTNATTEYHVDPKGINTQVQELPKKFSNVFKTGIGRCKSHKVSIHLNEGAQPSFSKPRPIPFAKQQATREELDRLVSEGVLKHVDFSEWAAPIVVVSKPSGKVRICGDFKQLNQRIAIDQHPLPRLDDLMEKLHGGQYFSKLDLADAYLQLELDEDSKKLCVINTPFGLYRYETMCFGVASSPAQFQRCMDSLTQKLPGVAAYLDDLIITGSTEKEHWENLNRLLSKLQEHGFRVRLDKCEFFRNSVEYLGHVIDKHGKRPADSAVAALKLLPVPQDEQQLKAFIGKITYYGRFISNMADKAAPLYHLLKDKEPFIWSNACQEAFEQLKSDIVNATHLSHYDQSKMLVLATDASSYGIGAVLSQQDVDGETPIAYASKTLNKAQKAYSQIEREALSIIYGVTKFRQFLYGRKFILVTDHEPLVSIFASNKNIPTLTAQRLQRWALTLMGFQYDIRYKRSSENGNADALSRLPLGPDPTFDSDDDLENQSLSHSIREEISSHPIDPAVVGKFTNNDPTLQAVIQCINNGWPANKPTDTDLGQFWVQRDSLTIHDNVLLLQRDAHYRVVIPKALQTATLDTLHSSHWGVVKIKQLARRYVWWSSINTDIENMTRSCDICKQHSSAPAQKYTEWPSTKSPWERLHLDFAGPFRGKMWLLCVDAHSKFPYVGMMEVGQTSSQQTVQVLRDIFSLEGLPNTIVTDNGPQFTSTIFEEFCRTHSIQHITSPAYHPPSNGEAERFVQTFKKAVEKNCVGGMHLKDSVRLALATYRMLPHPSLDWKTPSELLHGRQPRNLLSLLNPIHNPTHVSQPNTKGVFDVDSMVYARNYGPGPKWLPGKVLSKIGSTIFMVTTDKGIWKRHSNQLQIKMPEATKHSGDSNDTQNAVQHPYQPPEQTNNQPASRRYPLRARKAPERYVP